MIFNTPRRHSIKSPLSDLSYLIPEIYVKPLDQRRLEIFFQRFPHLVEQAYEKATHRFAVILLGIIRKAISTGMPPPGGGASWAPLTEGTIKNYTKWGHGRAHPWYVLGQMRREINIFKSNKKRVYVGFPRGVTATHPNPNSRSKSRPSLATLAASLESDTDHRSGRPLFNPAFKSAGGYERIQKFIIQELKKVFRKYGYNPYK